MINKWTDSSFNNDTQLYNYINSVIEPGEYYKYLYKYGESIVYTLVCKNYKVHKNINSNCFETEGLRLFNAGTEFMIRRLTPLELKLYT